MDTTDSGIAEEERNVNTGGWREIEIARTASVEAARREMEMEEEENNVFVETNLEVDVDAELRGKGSPQGSDDFFFFGDDGYPSPSLPPLPPSPRPSRLGEVMLETIGETSTDTMEEEGDQEDPTLVKVTRKTTLETVGESAKISSFTFDNIGETCTDDEILEAFGESEGQVGEARSLISRSGKSRVRRTWSSWPATSPSFPLPG